jgi:hypothetical protein
MLFKCAYTSFLRFYALQDRSFLIPHVVSLFYVSTPVVPAPALWELFFSHLHLSSALGNPLGSTEVSASTDP